MKFNNIYDYDVAAESLWRNLFNPEMEAAMKKAADLLQWNVTTVKEGGKSVRTVKVLPSIELPGAIKKIVGEKIGYTETDWVPLTGDMFYDWSVRSDAVGDKMTMTGIFKVESLGENRCRRTIAGDINVKIFGVGGLLEKFMVSEMEKMYAKIAVAQEQWLKQKKAKA